MPSCLITCSSCLKNMSLQDSFFNDNRDNRDNFCVQCICFNAMPLFQCEACCLYYRFNNLSMQISYKE